jgi:hypothetical protein
MMGFMKKREKTNNTIFQYHLFNYHFHDEVKASKNIYKNIREGERKASKMITHSQSLFCVDI